MLRTALVSTLAIFLTACGGGGSDPPAPTPGTETDTQPPSPPASAATATVAGAIQKGPFIIGSTVTINALTAAGANTASTIVTQTTDDLGRFSFEEEVGTLVQISSTGFYRSEITGNVSLGTITLRSLYSVTDDPDQRAYVNVLTHVTSGRALRLLADTEIGIGAAIDQAETEFLQQFRSVVPADVEREFNSISIHSEENAAGSAYLLAVSSIVHRYAMNRAIANGTNTDSELVVFLNGLAADFAADGDIDTPLTAVRAAIPGIDPAAVMSHVAAWTGNANVSVTDINEYLDSDLDGGFNVDDNDDDDDGFVDSIDPSPYQPNDPVLLSGTPQSNVSAGTAYFFRPTVMNPDHLSLAFSATGLPQWASLDTTNGTLSGTPTNANVGVYAGIRITATSTAGPVHLAPFSIEVAPYPWEVLTSLPMPRHHHGVAVLDGNLYAVGSTSSGVSTSTNFRYEIATDTWHPVAAMNVADRYDLRTHAIAGLIYAVGGDSSPQDVEVYNPATESWSMGTPMSSSRREFASCTHGGKVYVFGGFELNPGIRNLDSTEMLDTNTGTWVARAQSPRWATGAACATVNDQIFVFWYDTHYGIYDPVADTWQMGGQMPRARDGGSAAVVLDGKIYLLGGSGYPNPRLSTVDVLDPVTDTWTTKTPMPVALAYFGAAVWDGKIYVVGGSLYQNSPTASVYRYDPALDPR